MFSLFITTFLSFFVGFLPGVYYEPRPHIPTPVRVTPCIEGRQTYTTIAWYGRFEPGGKQVISCNHHGACKTEVVPNGGKWYEYFRYVEVERDCWY